MAVRLAKKIGGEVISADSRQVYKGLNIGTGKITKLEMREIPHHLLDVVNPKKQFSVAEYKKLAERAIADIFKRKKIPIICGGTGLYIDAVVNGIILPEVAPNIRLRKQLEKKTVKQLFAILKKLDPRRAKTIDAKNLRRLVRAIEIARAIGKSPNLEASLPSWNVLKIGLKLSDKILKQKIHIRLLSRIKQGMVAEVRRLNKGGLSWKRLEAFGLEYKYIALYLQKKITRDEMLTKLQTEIWRYAKRQNTWFKRDKNIKWFEPKEFKKIEKETKIFLDN
jgi:tRNA dimethylallyltransferase